MVAYIPEKLRVLLEACRTARGSMARGAALEDLVEHVFGCVPSVTLYGRDVLDESGSQEIDLAFTHVTELSRLPIYDSMIFVECKNERLRTSATQIYAFGIKLSTRAMNIGLLVTGAGLSGRKGRAGHGAIRDQLSNGVAIIVVTAKELANLSDSDGLATLVTNRLAELRTYRGYVSI